MTVRVIAQPTTGLGMNCPRRPDAGGLVVLSAPKGVKGFRFSSRGKPGVPPVRHLASRDHPSPSPLTPHPSCNPLHSHPSSQHASSSQRPITLSTSPSHIPFYSLSLILHSAFPYTAFLPYSLSCTPHALTPPFLFCPLFYTLHSLYTFLLLTPLFIMYYKRSLSFPSHFAPKHFSTARSFQSLFTRQPSLTTHRSPLTHVLCTLFSHFTLVTHLSPFLP